MAVCGETSTSAYLSFFLDCWEAPSLLGEVDSEDGGCIEDMAAERDGWVVTDG